MKAKNDLASVRFGKLIALFVSGKTPGRHALWRCVCDCGTEVDIVRGNLLTGSNISCGCVHRAKIAKGMNTKHGCFGTPEYNSWAGMIQRCTNKRHPAYPNYGGRGIFVCERWRDFRVFLADMGPSNGLTIERKNNDGGYTPENCKWATRAEQNRNTRRCRSRRETLK